MLVVQGRLTAEDGAALPAALDQTAAAVPAAYGELGPAAARAQALMLLATGAGQHAHRSSARPPHPALGARRTYGAGQPGRAVQLPPPAGA